MIKILIFTFSLVRKYSKFHFYLNTLISPIIAIIQTFGIISIGPLVAMLTEPRVIKENKFFQEYYFLTYENNNELIIQLSTIFLILNILGISLFFINSVLTEYVAAKSMHSLKKDLMEKYLNNSIKVTSQRTDFHGLISTEVAKFRTCVYSIMSFFHTSTSVLIFLSAVIFFERNLIFLVSMVFIFYTSIFLLNKNAFIKLSLEESNIAKKLINISLYITLGMKDLLALNLSKKFLKSLKKFQNKLIFFEIKKKVYLEYPRHTFEILIYCIFVFVIYGLYKSNLFESNLPKLSIILIFVWKSIPLFFNLFRTLSTFNSAKSVYINLKNSTKFLKIVKSKNNKILKKFNKTIQFDNVFFSYSKNIKFNFDFKISKRDKVLITGDSGSGKTTLLNLLSGLLKPDNGEIKIDGKNISNQKNNIFGFVTQDPILLPGTIFENIVISGNSKKAKIIELKKIYNICGIENITKNFENIYSKTVEFDSPELSGGQKQRVALARVLYMNPKVLILDEATSALDTKSEKKIFSSIIKEFKDLTLIAVSHKKINVRFNKIINLN